VLTSHLATVIHTRCTRLQPSLAARAAQPSLAARCTPLSRTPLSRSRCSKVGMLCELVAESGEGRHARMKRALRDEKAMRPEKHL
jgi:hypothetical protein